VDVVFEMAEVISDQECFRDQPPARSGTPASASLIASRRGFARVTDAAKVWAI
jgi:hypothetical protein